MKPLEVCPACAYRFEARDYRVWQNPFYALWNYFPAGLQSVPSRFLFLVQCPACAHAFEAKTIRYMGWISYSAYRIALVIAFAGLVVASSIWLLWFRI
jgi:hypothetical protein